mmetsp:Transcript_19437/g.18554  ORF Transcript_19437/g.18554 Transcript_19437/m.18554 type:complete len:111 (+) Transcript_19437:3-335(+)
MIQGMKHLSRSLKSLSTISRFSLGISPPQAFSTRSFNSSSPQEQSEKAPQIPMRLSYNNKRIYVRAYSIFHDNTLLLVQPAPASFIDKPEAYSVQKNGYMTFDFCPIPEN